MQGLAATSGVNCKNVDPSCVKFPCDKCRRNVNEGTGIFSPYPRVIYAITVTFSFPSTTTGTVGTRNIFLIPRFLKEIDKFLNSWRGNGVSFVCVLI